MLDYDLERLSYTQSEIAIHALEEALEVVTENQRLDLRDDYSPDPPLFWPSNLLYIDANVGGFYGMTTIAAEKGTGKTLIATASAISAAATRRWQVCHFLAEDDYDGFRERFNLFLSTHPEAHSCFDHFHPVAVGKGQTPKTLVAEVKRLIEPGSNAPILIVLDSINSIVNLSGGPYLQGLSDMGLWAMFARKISRGRASFLINSETNKRGESKGESLPSWSDVYLKMKKCSESVVEMRLDKTRRTKGEGDMGKYVRRWDAQEFEKAPMIVERPKLRAVGSDDWSLS